MGNKGGGKRISKKVIQYLQAYFHADISEIKIIKGWIGIYSTSSKKEMSEKALEQSAIEESSLITNTTYNRAKKWQKRG
ncbi:hypothetical protein C1646_768446 [Rhizophagus diaphanus]|nr:hypothetical protein C1646_768446 [Rhizophagus diaphanus] [Rhizophagus sp. MUCL 43196]